MLKYFSEFLKSETVNVLKKIRVYFAFCGIITLLNESLKIIDVLSLLLNIFKRLVIS